MSEIVIACRDLRMTYPGKPPVEAVRGLDLEVRRGECFGVLGPNGAGKTTTIEILEGLLTPTQGEVEILGMKYDRQGDAIRQRIGISLQETRLADKLSVVETLRLFRSFYSGGMDPDEAMARVSLQEKARAWVKNLSGGQRQRLAVAAALVGDPDLLFLDEPTTGLDPQSRRQLWEVIENFIREQRTVLLTTHYMEEAERLCHRVAIVDRGRIIAQGSPRELIATLGSDHVIEFTLLESAAESATAEAVSVRRLWDDIPDVTSATVEGGGYRLSATRPHEVLPALMKRLDQAGQKLASLTTRHASLEDVFVQLTGRHLTDDEFSADEETRA